MRYSMANPKALNPTTPKAANLLGTGEECGATQGLKTLKSQEILLMDKILHDPKDPKLWELWYIPFYGSCRILSISRTAALVSGLQLSWCRKNRDVGFGS